MKESLASIPIVEIVILFILLFTGVMCLTINHSKAYGVKDEIVNIIQNAGYDFESDGKTISEIANYLSKAGYHLTGDCNGNKWGTLDYDDWVGYAWNGSVTSNSDAAFCIRRVNVKDVFYDDLDANCSGSNCCKGSTCELTDDLPKMAYYDVRVFYQLDLPIINSMLNLHLTSSTKVLYK